MNKKSATLVFAGMLLSLSAGVWFGAMWSTRQNAAENISAKKSGGAKNSGAISNNRVAKFANAEEARAAIKQLINGPGGMQQLRAMLAFADSVDMADLPDLLDVLRGMHSSAAGSDLEKALLDRWVGANPTAAAAWATDLKNSLQKEAALKDVFEAWSARDPATALTAVDGKMNPHAREEVLAAVFKNYGAQNPAAAVAALNSLPAEWGMGGLSQFIYQTWARTDPASAATAAANMPAGYAKMMALSLVAQAWTAQDPAAGMEWAKTQLGAGVSWYAVQGMVEQNPQEAAAHLGDLYNGNGRDGLTAVIANYMASTDPAAALDWLNKNATGSAYNRAMGDLIASFGADNAATFAPTVLQMPAGKERDNAIAQLAYQWGTSDREGALAWAQSLPASDGQTRLDALSGIISIWGERDPAAAVNYVSTQLAGDPSQMKLLQDTVNDWSVYDPSAALAWAQKVTDPAANAEAMSMVIKGVTAANPQLGVQYAESLPAGEARTQALANAAVMWSANNPTAAAGLLSSIPAGDTQNSTAQQIATRWTKNDPGAASQWINSLPAGGARDAAVEGLITVVGKSDPAGVFNWAVSMNNETSRLSQLRTTVQQWAQTDAGAAANAVQNAANLNATQRADLLEAVKTAAAGKKVGQF